MRKMFKEVVEYIINKNVNGRFGRREVRRICCGSEESRGIEHFKANGRGNIGYYLI